MNKNLERMTRAIGESYDGCADPVDTPNNWARAEAAARAALEAMQEPLERKARALSANYYRAERDRSEACLTDILQILEADGDPTNKILDRLIQHYERCGNVA